VCVCLFIYIFIYIYIYSILLCPFIATASRLHPAYDTWARWASVPKPTSWATLAGGKWRFFTWLKHEHEGCFHGIYIMGIYWDSMGISGNLMIPWIEEILHQSVDRWFFPLFVGFQPSKVQDFFHPQYVVRSSGIFQGICDELWWYLISSPGNLLHFAMEAMAHLVRWPANSNHHPTSGRMIQFGAVAAN